MLWWDPASGPGPAQAPSLWEAAWCHLGYMRPIIFPSQSAACDPCQSHVTASNQAGTGLAAGDT